MKNEYTYLHIALGNTFEIITEELSAGGFCCHPVYLPQELECVSEEYQICSCCGEGALANPVLKKYTFKPLVCGILKLCLEHRKSHDKTTFKECYDIEVKNP